MDHLNRLNHYSLLVLLRLCLCAQIGEMTIILLGGTIGVQRGSAEKSGNTWGIQMSRIDESLTSAQGRCRERGGTIYIYIIYTIIIQLYLCRYCLSYGPFFLASEVSSDRFLDWKTDRRSQHVPSIECGNAPTVSSRMHFVNKANELLDIWCYDAMI